MEVLRAQRACRGAKDEVEGCRDQGEEGLSEDAASNGEVLEYPKNWLTLFQDEKLGPVKGTTAKVLLKMVSAVHRRDIAVRSPSHPTVGLGQRASRF